jgi:ribonucleoside-triphosphate reductase
MKRFRLRSAFLAEFEGKQPNWGPVGYVTYKRTYSRNDEEFWETCQRVVEGVYNVQKGHCHRLGLRWDNKKAHASAEEMFRRMFEFKWSPPGRGLFMMGTDYVEKRGGAPLNNCGFVTTENLSVDLATPFCWLMEMSMLGVGVGFDTKGSDRFHIKDPVQGDDVHVVEDSREGWVDLIRRLFTAYSGKGSLPASVDYSEIRPAGEPIKGFGGTSSGPGPLQELYEAIQGVLEARRGAPLRSEDIVDLANLIGRCVVSGNVRRSAEIAFGEPGDQSFLELKDPEKNGEALTSHRWASNNSVFASVGMDYSQVARLTSKNGEPGYEWLDNARAYGRMKDPANYRDRRAAGGNPCLEQTLEDRELCCLVEVYPSNHDSEEDFRRTLKFAFLYAKSVTLLPTHDEYTNQVLLRNRRIGTSVSGIVQAIERHGRREFLNWLDRGYTYLKELDAEYSDWLCVRESIKITSVKPSGTISLLPGVTPGIHYPHSEYYIRRIRFNSDSPLVAELKQRGYRVEKDKYSPRTMVVEFPIHEQYYSRSKREVTMWEQLELAAQIQHYWADNQVSVTVTFTEEEVPRIKDALEYYETRLKGVSFLPLDDHGYEQAPYEEITEAEYTERTKGLKPLTGLDIERDQMDAFCDGDVCLV